MGKILLVVAFWLGWVGITCLIYGFFVRRWVETESFGAHVGLGLLGGIFLAPGLLVGHGVLPFPGGAAFLILLVSGNFDAGGLVNLVGWLVSAAVFAPFGWWAVRRKNAQEARIDE